MHSAFIGTDCKSELHLQTAVRKQRETGADFKIDISVTNDKPDYFAVSQYLFICSQ